MKKYGIVVRYTKWVDPADGGLDYFKRFCSRLGGRVVDFVRWLPARPSFAVLELPEGPDWVAVLTISPNVLEVITEGIDECLAKEKQDKVNESKRG